MNENELVLLWGKTVKGDNEAYHPLLFHLLDVGHCALALWDKFLNDEWRSRLRKVFELPLEETKCAVVWLAAWHDVGKAASGFQLQESGPKGLRQLLVKNGFVPASDKAPHAQVSAQFLKKWLSDGENPLWQTSLLDAKVWAHVIGAHHGFFPSSQQLVNVKGSVLGAAKWQQARVALCETVAALLVPNAANATLRSNGIAAKTDGQTKGALAFLTGLISVADWLGSSEKFLAAGRVGQIPENPATYAARSRSQAAKALHEFGWLPAIQIPLDALDFETQFGFPPNPLQEQLLGQSAQLKQPFLAIVEAQMGTGKTEAAFAAIDAALQQKQARGFYIALPTQATGNAMFKRVAQKFFAHGRYGAAINLQLVHSHSFLHHLEINAPAAPSPYSAENETPFVAPQEWFMGAKRPLLAPFGVGTIDQSLTGVLSVKHWFVRLFGLAGKVVVLDEVHSYSLYMSHILDRMLDWLRALDCSVILLSATLPSARRHQLIAAWGATVPATEARYPRLTWVDEEAVSLPIAAPEREKRLIQLEWSATDSSAIAARLRVALKEGGCAAIICNTVVRAQTLFGDLQRELATEWQECEWTLFHARMPFAWRQEREEKVKRLFGRPKAGQASHRPHRAITISTQVLEQSLDFSKDWMASELAPVDLLLQRAGRLHRHAEVEPPAPLKNAQFVILCNEEEGFPVLDLPPEIYEHYTLMQTFRALRTRRRLPLPRAIEPLIERVYVRPRKPGDLWKNRLDGALEAQKIRSDAAQTGAENVLLPLASSGSRAKSFVEPTNALRADAEDPTRAQEVKATTRDGRPSVAAICLLETDEGLFLPPTDPSELLRNPNALGAPVALGREPDANATMQMMKFAVPISHARIYHALTKEENEALYLPPSWRRNSHLRYARYLKFRGGRCTVANTVLRLDPILGLVIGDLPSNAALQPEDE